MNPEPRPAHAPENRIPMPLTVRAALELPALRRGLPDVVAGHAGLDAPIRWVHTGEIENIASMLEGGEMLLTTGLGIGSRAAEQRRFVARLAERGAVALVIELGGAFDELPNALVDAAGSAGLPLVALRTAIPFVAVTEALHTEIVSSHYALLRRGEQIQRELTDLMLDGGGIPEVLAALAATLQAPIFLEGPRGRLLSHALPPGSSAEAFDAWEIARRRLSGPADEAAAARDVRAAAVRMGSQQGEGRLLVAELRAPYDAVASIALDQAASVVALALLRARQEEELVARERGSFLVKLADGRVSPAATGRAALAAGMERLPELLLPVVAEARIVIAPATGEWEAALRSVQRLFADRGLTAVAGRRPGSATVLAVIALRDAAQRTEAAETAADALREALVRRTGAEWVTVAVGRASALETIGAELKWTEESAASAVALPARGWHDVHALELRRLLWASRDDAALAALVTRVLGPLLAHDRERKLVLLPTLEALLANGGRKAETARALHLNRQALYHRLTRIEELLGVDLGDAEQLLTLHVAVFARQYVGT